MSERLNALLNGEKIDRIPHLSFILGFCARNYGIPLSNIYSDPERSFEAQWHTREQYGFDSEPFFGYASYGGWEFGGEIKLPEGEYEQAPSHQKMAMESIDDIETLSLPNVATDGILPLAMRFSQTQIQNNRSPSLVMGGPFTVASNICSVDKLCRWLIKEPDVARRLMRLATDHLIEVGSHWVDTFGVNNVSAQIWEPVATNQIISPRQFEAFVFPYQLELHEKLLKKGIRYILCHICGEQNENLDLWKQIPMGQPGIVSFGKEVEIRKAIEMFGDHAIIAGNIDPSLLQTGTPERIYQVAREAIEAGKKAPIGYALMEGCEVPVNTPPFSYYTLRKAALDFGYY